jgi:hypothetical protein
MRPLWKYHDPELYAYHLAAAPDLYLQGPPLIQDFRTVIELTLKRGEVTLALNRASEALARYLTPPLKLPQLTVTCHVHVFLLTFSMVQTTQY